MLKGLSEEITKGWMEMNLTIINSIRTNNFSDDLMMQKITDLWKVAAATLTEPENTVYGIYHNYESDYKGDYSLSIAIENNGEEPSIVIPNHQKYEVFRVDNDDEQGVMKAWSKIWELEELGTLTRTYTYDFEKYNPTGKIEIYIAIK